MKSIFVFLLLALGLRILMGPIRIQMPDLFGFMPNEILTRFQFRQNKKKDHIQEVTEFLIGFRSLVSTGVPTGIAFQRALTQQDKTFLPNTRAAIAAELKITEGLQLDNQELKIDALKRLQLVLQVSSETGAPIINALDVLISGCIAWTERQALIRNELSSTKSTVTILATLPLIGLGLSSLLGMNTVSWLFTNRIGLLCIFVGATFELLGIYWVKTIIRSANGRAA